MSLEKIILCDGKALILTKAERGDGCLGCYFGSSINCTVPGVDWGELKEHRNFNYIYKEDSLCTMLLSLDKTIKE